MFRHDERLADLLTQLRRGYSSGVQRSIAENIRMRTHLRLTLLHGAQTPDQLPPSRIAVARAKHRLLMSSRKTVARATLPRCR
jgi:hypothetical protein